MDKANCLQYGGSPRPPYCHKLWQKIRLDPIAESNLLLLLLLYLTLENRTVITQISLLVPSRMSGPNTPTPEVTILCILPFCR